MRDQLFLLPPGFVDNARREYCPECAEIWGLLHYFPAIKESLDIVYEPIGHPRPALTAALGEGEWNCPTLVLAAIAPGIDPEAAGIQERRGRFYIDNARDIGRYFMLQYGTPAPRGS